ncbi:hypothetical protein ILUMI_11860, partial [Ignelater luminosus]
MIIQKFVVFCGSFLFINAVSPQEQNSKTSGTDASALIEKFHQSDYNVTFERVEIVNFNKRYMKRLEAVTFKYNRTCAVVNATWMLNVNTGYSSNVVVQAYRFASNEYRLFPALRLELNVCEAINENLIGLKRLKHCSNFTGCPFLK